MVLIILYTNSQNSKGHEIFFFLEQTASKMSQEEVMSLTSMYATIYILQQQQQRSTNTIWSFCNMLSHFTHINSFVYNLINICKINLLF